MYKIRAKILNKNCHNNTSLVNVFYENFNKKIDQILLFKTFIFNVLKIGYKKMNYLKLKFIYICI